MWETRYCHVSTNVKKPPLQMDLISGTSNIPSHTGITAAKTPSTMRFQVPRSMKTFEVFKKNFSFSSKPNPSLSRKDLTTVPPGCPMSNSYILGMD